MKTFLAMWIVAVGMCTGSLVHSQEMPIKESDVPMAVRKATVGLSKGATINGYSKETEKGKVYYEVELLVYDHHKYIVMNPSGVVMAIGEDVPLDSVSGVVKAGIKKLAGNGEIVNVQSISKGTKLVGYEAVIKTDGKESEVQVNLDGEKTTVEIE